MAKGQKRSSREAKKPKQKKPAAAVPVSTPSTASSKQRTYVPANKK